MCTYSMVADHYNDLWKRQTWYQALNQFPTPSVTREEFDELKRQVLEMKELLKRAKEYDERTGQPDCEMDEKVDLLRKIAKIVGVDLSEVTTKTAQQ